MLRATSSSVGSGGGPTLNVRAPIARPASMSDSASPITTDRPNSISGKAARAC